MNFIEKIIPEILIPLSLAISEKLSIIARFDLGGL